ncbi:MAG: S8 family serine peptidase [Verrucomicrobiota bacterium]
MSPRFLTNPSFLRKLLAGLALASALALTVRAAPMAGFVEGEVIVTYRKNVLLDTAKAAAVRRSAKMTRHFAWLSNHHKQVIGLVSSSTKSTAALIAELANDPDVLVAEPIYLRHVSSLQPSDPFFGTLWALKNTGQSVNGNVGTNGADIGFAPAWNLARPINPEVVVAVIDTGLDTTHPDIVANLWTNPGETPGNNLDDDGNGRIDDIHGFNFPENNSNVADTGVHGTHIAGTIAATGNNSLGVIGADFKARIMALKVAIDETTLSTAAEIAAMEYAAMMKSNGVNIVAINASYGSGTFSSAESLAITAVGNVGIVFCAAAGNESANDDTTPTYPANYRLPNMIVVAASSQTDQLASFSNFGATTVDLAAPGANILSLKPTWLATASPTAAAGTTPFPATAFLNAGTTPAITATLIICGTGNSAAQFPPTVAGNIALIERGIETFGTKVTHAMNAGAVAAIIYNNVAGPIGNGTLGPPANFIPTVGVSQADGVSLLGLVNSPVTVANAVIPATIYHFLNGTSMATPQVAAAVAFSARNFPAETAVQRVGRVINHTTPVPALSGLVKSGGRLNLLNIVDTNANELPDWWETDHFTTLCAIPTADPDGDGMNNLQEFLAGTGPDNSVSRFAILQSGFVPTPPPGAYILTFASVPGIVYRVEMSDTLAPDSWSPLGPDLTGTGGILQAADSAADKPAKRFYRVRVIP